MMGVMGKVPLWACAAVALTAIAWDCGGASSAGTQPPPDDDAGFASSDSGAEAGPKVAPDGGAGTRLVVVHTGEPKLAAFRVCVSDGALPEPSDPTRPMPKSNYPGIAVGGAAYVGVVTDGPLSLTLYDALTLAISNKSTESCGDLRNDATIPAYAREAVDTTGVTLSSNALNVVGIYGSVGQTKAIAAPLDSSFTTASQPLRVAFGHISPDHQAAKITAVFSARDGGAPVPLGTEGFGEVGPLTSTTFPIDASTTSYDDYGVMLASPAQFFSLTDVTQGTDSTQTPSTLLGGRSNFAFVLVGYDTVPDGGSPGQQLHVVAISTPQ